MHHAARNARLLLVGAFSRDRTDDLHDYWRYTDRAIAQTAEACLAAINNRSNRCCQGVYATDAGNSKRPGGKVLGRQACQAIEDPLMSQVWGVSGCGPTNGVQLVRRRLIKYA